MGQEKHGVRRERKQECLGRSSTIQGGREQTKRWKSVVPDGVLKVKLLSMTVRSRGGHGSKLPGG